MDEEKNEIAEENTADARQTQDEPDNTDSEQPSAEQSPVGSWFSNSLDFIQTYVLELAIVLLLFTCLFRVCTVSGTSMLPTLQHNEKLLISNCFYEPQNGDIIVFHQTSEVDAHYNEPIIKRVIATGGQTVQIDFTDATVCVNGILLDEPYIQLTGGQYHILGEHDMYYEEASDGTMHRILRATVPEGTVFVMGDNRNDSSDSRTNIIGFVDTRRILGHVLYRISPFDVAGKVQ